MSPTPTTYSKSPDVVFRKIGDEFVLVPIRQRASDLQSIYALSEVAGRVWELIDGKNTIADIQQVIIDEFDVSPQQAEEDLQLLIKRLTATGSIKTN